MILVATDWGSIAEWVSGLGALAAAVVALVVSARAQRDAREARRAASRDRAAGLLVDLLRTVEKHRAAIEHGAPTVEIRSEGAALCRALWGRRNLFGTTWHLYCEEDQRWIADLLAAGELFPRMREELQAALDALDHEDRAA